MSRSLLSRKCQFRVSNWCQRRWLYRRCLSMQKLNEENGRRISQLQIQMLTEALHKQIFQETVDLNIPSKKIESVEKHLQRHGLWNRPTSVIDDVDLKLPPLQGDSIEEHFFNIAQRQVAEYKSLAQDLADTELPQLPKEWSLSKGWTKYFQDGSVKSVPYPEEHAVVFDIECLMREGNFPTMATAVSKHHWYSWVSDYVIEDKYRWSDKPTLSDLIPLETKPGSNSLANGQTKRLVIGHNVGFDRSFVKEQYYIQGTATRFLDTMSMHIAVCGLTNFQRILFQASRGKSMRKEVLEHQQKQQRWNSDTSDEWKRISTMNNLNDVYQLHCKGEPLKKATREVFIEGTMSDVRQQFQELMSYCAGDVMATLAVFKELWPSFLQRFPHPVTLSGMMEMGTAYLPINTNWERYINQSNTTYSEMQRELKNLLMSLANDACALLYDERYKDDPWLWDLDWTVKDYQLKKQAPKTITKVKGEVDNINLDTEEDDEPFPNPNGVPMLTVKDCRMKSDEDTAERDRLVQKLINTADRIPKNETFLAGYPAWYRDLCPRLNSEDWYPGPSLISTQVRVTPKLLRLTWDGYPVHYDAEHGWGYLVPGDTETELDKELTNQEGEDEVSELKFPIRSLQEFLAVTKPELYGADLEKMRLTDDPLGRNFDYNAMDEVEIRKHWATANRGKHKKPPTASPGDGPFDVGLSGCLFYKIPHKDGVGKRVGNPLAKDYLLRVEDGTLKTATGADADRVLSLGKICSYWKNNQERIGDQMAVWLKKNELPRCITGKDEYEDSNLHGAIVPRIAPAGTITRRAVEQTWLTASNAYVDRIGSELKAMVQVPPGYHFVGADVDSQELWIASIIGDANFQKLHGCTALGWMTLQGNKAEKTDLHSKTAETVDISRDHAKVMNYGRIYGAGQKFAEKLLLQFNPKLSPDEARQKAKKMYTLTKGKRSQQGEWVGGSESHMFNGLEKIARSETPRTPVLDCRISKALEPKNVHDDFMTSRVNWVVQSSAVDYLHLMLVSMHWLFQTFSIRGRFCISIHDEVRYIVRSEDRYRAALALQITNLWTRCMFASRLGMKDLPQSVAFFSSVDIDSCMRKEVNMDCKTPSNPHGLARGYGIPQGEALDIYQILNITNGSLSSSGSSE